MREAGNLAGYDTKNKYESKLIDEIIENVHGSLPKILDVNENIVGMDSCLEKLRTLLKIELNDVRMVKVYGLGGISKTTIINALYNQILYHFESVSLLTNVRKESTENSGLLKTKGQIVLKNVYEGIEKIRDKLSSKNVLIFLDDVDKLTQLEHLIGKHDWFGPGSRIIITTREKYLLTRHGVDDMYKVDKLKFQEVLQLFCCYAFKQHHLKEGYRDLPHQVVQYADGLPLALKVLGSLLFGKQPPDWESKLRKLKKEPHMEIVKTTRKLTFSDKIFLCVSLESLPGDIHESKHLLTLHCNGCSKLTSFPKIKCNIEKLEVLSLNETAIKEPPSSIELLENLCYLYLGNCKNLEDLPNNICNLRFLKVLILGGCSKLDRLPEDLERMPCLEFLSLDSLNCQLPSLLGLSLLRGPRLDQCNLTPRVIKSDNCLNALKVLSLRNCNLNGGAFSCIFHLSSLEDLRGHNPEEGGILNDILVGINQLANLRGLDLNMHSSIETSLPPMHSLVNCLKSASQDLKHEKSSNRVFLANSNYIGHWVCIVVPGSNGIPNWIRNQREGCQIIIELPQNWYENNDFLGIAICSVYVPLDECESDFAHTSENESGDEALNESDDLFEAESSISTQLACQLTFSDRYGFSSLLVGHLSFRTTCKCYRDGGVSEQMWVIFYPKAAILESCHTNHFTFLKALFMDSINHFKVLKCGLQPIYTKDRIVQTEDVDASCFECQRNVECRKLCLKGQIISQLPIKYACELDTLCLRECKNLEKILENMENLRQLHLNGTAIKELPASIQHLNRLEVLNLDRCQNLVTVPESICNLCFLEVLNVSYCSKLHKLPQNLGRLQSLKYLGACGLNSTCCQLLSLSGLCSLETLILYRSKLMQGVIGSGICSWYSLKELNLSCCAIDEGGIPTKICRLSSLQCLHLIGNLFRSIPTGINQLSMLRLLDLALSSSLLVLDVHECTRLETSSDKLFAQVNLIISGSSGIPKWISHHKRGPTVVAKLPQNWHKNNNFLGFVLYCVYDPLDNESEGRLENHENYFKFGLTLRGHEIQLVDDLQFYHSRHCYDVVEIQKKYHSNKWRQLTASFSSYVKGKEVKVEECGIHLIYAYDLEQNHGKAMIPTICQECQEDVQSRRKLCLKGNAINELSTIDYPPKPYSLCLLECKNIERLPSSICELKPLTTLFCSEELPSSFEHLQGLQCLKLARCDNLVSLPESFCNLSSLITLDVSFCTKLEKFPKNLRSLQRLKHLYASGTAIEELPSSFEHLQGLQCFKLARCDNLVSLPESFCNLSSLITLDVSFCTKLEKFPKNLRSLQRLKHLYASGTAIEELPSSFEHLQGLQCFKLARCNSLVSLPESICNLSSLRTLNVSFCTELEKLPENLRSLQCLNFCTKLEKFPENLRRLQCLEDLHTSGLNLSMDCFSSILAGITQLSKLRVLELSHCQGLLQVPELPPSLQVLDVHSWTCLETLSSPSSLLGVSLFKCFKSTIEEFECGSYCNKAIRVVISGNNGIPEWISQQKKGSQITIELPMDWYRKDDFLGFALYSVFIPMACDGLNCELNICGDQSECCHVDDVCQMCVTYYPKAAINNQYWSNKWRRLKVSFRSFDGTPVEVKEWGPHIKIPTIYTRDVIDRNIPEDTSTDAQRSCDNTEAAKRDHQTMIEYSDEQRSFDTRSAAEDTNSNAQASYDCTQCTEHSDSPMDTTTQNINSNVVDA
ncbi:hypothetical protein PVL29_013568 [Vitis rotundifolia]|uniref:ADP-ribosyl cyclase/cyclic ADP-ribose hydrolase n=1 Tax=Vitis rotundifolia TaxID=103349 RepID=A0AA38ZM77_VITRO|nr:hypothetical protein PVL29_013568 [Vitis rotundifolia]